jgi:hypothetical protein
VRKPVSRFWFRLVWPLLWQRRFLMPLMASKAIYCFYTKPLVKALAELIGDRQCVEIAAGDGTLSRFLNDAGASVTATDDHSWSGLRFPDSVIREDAEVSLRKAAGRSCCARGRRRTTASSAPRGAAPQHPRCITRQPGERHRAPH